MFSKLRGKTKFQLIWTESFPWAQPVEGNPFAAKCKLCLTTIAVDSMGRQALKSHGEGKKHLSREGSSSSSFRIFQFVKRPSTSTENVDDPDDPLPLAAGPSTRSTSLQFPTTPTLEPLDVTPLAPTPQLLKVTPTSSPTGLVQVVTPSQPTDLRPPEEPPKKKLKTSVMQSFLTKENVTKAEILWSLFSVTTHMSLRSAGSAVSLFKKMFADDEVAQKMQLQKTKISYIIVHGLGHYFENQLRTRLKKCKHVVIGFDESLNKIAQKQQMDVNVRFWDDSEDKVVARYLTSQFLEHATAEHLLQSLKTALGEIEHKKVLQISMDGPNVNHKMIRLWKEEMTDDGLQLLDIGSCGLHTVHCAFKYAIKSTNWVVVEFLRAIYNIFKDVPSRRGDFKGITGCSTFPIKFCSIRWIENARVAERALQIFPKIEEYIKSVKSTKKEPKCNSFRVIEFAIKNKLLRAQIAFFQSLAEKSTPFLTEFQTDAPMAPFLYTSLRSILNSVMQQIVKKEVYDNTDLTKIDLTKKENLKTAKNIMLGFGTKSAIRSCNDFTEQDILRFRNECRECLVVFSTRMTDRSPLKFTLTKSITCFDPQKALEGAERDVSSLLETLVKSSVITGSEADKALLQFTQLTSRNVVHEKLKTFKRNETRLDNFWVEILKELDDEPKELKRVVKVVLLLSHGNAAVERGFSINKDCIVPNQTEKSLVAQRNVIEAINLIGGVENISVTKEMIHAARNARARYEESLEEHKRLKEEEKKAEVDKRKSKALIKELEIERQKLLEETQRKMDKIEEKLLELKKK